VDVGGCLNFDRFELPDEQSCTSCRVSVYAVRPNCGNVHCLFCGSHRSRISPATQPPLVRWRQNSNMLVNALRKLGKAIEAQYPTETAKRTSETVAWLGSHHLPCKCTHHCLIQQ